MGNDKLRDLRREQVLNKLADHILATGLHNASLRPLAAAVGTSDRMLLYYFRDKDDLIAAILTRIAERLQAMLNQHVSAPKAARALLPELAAMVRSPDVRPYLQLWLELAARASRGEQPYQRIAHAIAAGFQQWISSLVRVRNDADRSPVAAHLFCLIEGLVLFDSVGHSPFADLAIQHQIEN